MLTAAWKNKAVAALLFAVLLAVIAPCAHAAKVLSSERLQELFPSASRVVDNNDAIGVVFRVEDCPCYAMIDSRSRVRHIFVCPPEKARKSRKSVSKMQTTAEQLAKFLEQYCGKVDLQPFDDENSGYTLTPAVSKSSAEEYRRSSLGAPTTTLVSRLLRRGGTFYRCDEGELVMKVPDPSVSNSFCHLAFSLSKGNADVIALMPGRFLRRSDEKLLDFAESVLNLSYHESPGSYRYSGKFKDVRSSTGASKCIGFNYIDDECDWAMVYHRRRYLVGTDQSLGNYIRRKRASGYLAKIDFPQQSDSLPSIEEETVAPEEKGMAQKTPPAAQEARNDGMTIEQICDYLGCPYPVERDGCVCLRLDNCRVVIPLPDTGRADEKSPLRLPIQTLYVHAPGQSAEASPSQRHALFVSFMLSVSDSAAVGVHPSDNTISQLKFRNGIAPKEPKEAVVKELLHADNFPDTQEHPWPEKSRTGKAIPAGWRTLVTPKPDAALKDYMDYLIRLMK